MTRLSSYALVAFLFTIVGSIVGNLLPLP